MGEVLLYRGINQPNLKNKIGHWWSTNPYYAQRFMGPKGEMYVAKIDSALLEKMSKDVSIEAEFQNYFFEEDPPGVRRVLPEEITLLLGKATYSEARLGGTLMKPPDDPIAAGKEIFG